MTSVTSLEKHRTRQKALGRSRVEVQVAQDDVALVRRVVAALNDPHRSEETRRLLLTRFGQPQATGLKALLAAAPLEGIDLDRVRDLDRDVDL